MQRITIGRMAAPILSHALCALGIIVLWPGSASAQPPLRLNENCIVSVLNRNTRVKPDGTWVLPNIPANFGLVRARATCVFDGVTVSGESAPFLVLANASVNVPPIVLGLTTPIPTALDVTATPPELQKVAQTGQVSVQAHYGDGSVRNVTAASTGTLYVISNPAIATISGNGLVTALASGTALVQATHEGTSGFTSIRVVLTADSDGDGMADDLELALGLNPNNAADALEDPDRDGLNNRDEANAGTDLRHPDSDSDGLLDGEEARPGADGFITNPLLADTDGDGVRDALEVATGTNPTNPASFNLGKALKSLTVSPETFTITINSVQGEGFRQLTVTGILQDGTILDLTSTTRGTNYTSSNLNVCNFGTPDGRVFGADNGQCTITASNSGHSDTALGTVTNFTPTALGSLAIPGYANNVDANGSFAFVAAGSTGLQIVNVANPSSPVIIASLDTPGNANDVRVVGNLAYVADGSSGLRIIDVTNPAAPVALGSLDTPGEANDVFVTGRFAYIADGTSGVQIIDISQPAAPTLIRTIDTPGTARGVDVDGTTLVVADDNPSLGLRVIDVANPATASIVGNVPLFGEIIDVDLANGFAFVAAYTGGVHVVDVRNPAAPSAVANIPGSSPNGFVPRDVQVAGAFAIFAEQLFASAVAPIVDISNPATPFFRTVLNFGLDYAGTGVAVSGQFVYWTGQSFVVSSENGVNGTTRLFIGQYIATVDLGGLAPTVAITSPLAGSSVVEGTPLPVRVNAVDDIAVSSVTFFANKQAVATDSSEPYETVITVPPAPGPLVLGARAVDFGGNTGNAVNVSVNVTPDPKTTVIGRVVDKDANPVGGATVTVLTLKTTTGSDGTFSIANVPTVLGPLTVRAEAIVAGRTVRGSSTPALPVPNGTTKVGDITLRGGGPIGLLHCDQTGVIRPALIATGLFTAADLTDINVCGAPPTLQKLQEFGALLVWSNFPFGQRDALGNLLADYVDQGGGVVLATYAFTTTWAMGGRIMTAGYSPFNVLGSNGGGFNGNSGRLDLASSNTAHPIMNGVGAPTADYFFNSNYTNPSLTAGAALIAVDDGGNRAVAVGSSGRIVGINIWPGSALPAEIGRLFANALIFVR